MSNIASSTLMSYGASHKTNPHNHEAQYYALWTVELLRLCRNDPNFIVNPQFPLSPEGFPLSQRKNITHDSLAKIDGGESDDELLLIPGEENYDYGLERQYEDDRPTEASGNRPRLEEDEMVGPDDELQGYEEDEIADRTTDSIVTTAGSVASKKPDFGIVQLTTEPLSDPATVAGMHNNPSQRHLYTMYYSRRGGIKINHMHLALLAEVKPAPSRATKENAKYEGSVKDNVFDAKLQLDKYVTEGGALLVDSERLDQSNVSGKQLIMLAAAGPFWSFQVVRARSGVIWRPGCEIEYETIRRWSNICCLGSESSDRKLSFIAGLLFDS